VHVASNAQPFGATLTLAAALVTDANEQGLDLEVIADPDKPLDQATVPSIVPMRDPLDVGTGPTGGRLVFAGWGVEIAFIIGDATDLDELARVAHAWQTGVPMREYTFWPHTRDSVR
jgi:hypothetical protein